MTRPPRIGWAAALTALLLAGCTLGGRHDDPPTGVQHTTAPPSASSYVPPVDTLGHRSDVPVAPAEPDAVSIPSVGIHAAVKPIVSEHTPDGGWVIDPPAATPTQLESAYWWKEPEYSAEPGNPSQGTTFLYAHACQGVRCAFDTLHEVIPGNEITVSTPAGTLTYRVDGPPLDLAKSPEGLGSSTDVYDYGVPNRLVLITCGYLPDGRSTYNWAVIADLVAAETSRPD